MTARASWHGTVNGYTNHDCRCDDCRAAMAAYHRERRRQFREGERPIPSEVPHGVHTTRTYYGCTCRSCRDAHAAYERDRVARKRAAS